MTFTAPGASTDTETFALTIDNAANPDRISGLTMGDLANLSFALPGVLVSDLHFVADGAGGSPFADDVWQNPEQNTARLFLKADFTAVPEPGSLLLVGSALFGLGMLHRPGRSFAA